MKALLPSAAQASIGTCSAQNQHEYRPALRVAWHMFDHMIG
jgi:hypothetical protein